MCLPPAGVLVWKKAVINQLQGFDEEFGKGFEDFHLVARASKFNYVIAILDSPLYLYQRGHESLSQSWSPEEERKLRSKVNKLAMDLCEHQVEEIFELIARHGNLILVSHPDFVFEINKNKVVILFGKILSPSRYRNNAIARALWALVPPFIRRPFFRFATKISKGV
jgi:hypothetical protein